MNLRLSPGASSHDLPVERDRDPARFNPASRQQLRDRLVDEGLVDSIDADHANLSANSSASKELSGAKVTPWR